MNEINAKPPNNDLNIYLIKNDDIHANCTQTKCYSHATRGSHINEVKRGGNKNKPKTDNSFESTGYCADAGNQVPNDLVDFTAKYNPQNKMFRVSKTNVSLSERRSQTCLDYAERKKRR